MKHARIIIAAVLCSAFAGAAMASWYDDYDAGLAATRKGQWQVAVQKMTAAINGNGKEGDKTRTYGAIFISYHPYYYRGVANLNSGRYEQAISDLEKTSGPGEENLGSIGELIQRAKSKLAESTTPPPPVTNTVAVTPPVTATQAPPPPAIDNALRNRARAALDQAKSHLESARQRNATASPSYQRAIDQYTDANTRLASARNNEDLNTVIASADNVALLADSASAPVIAVTTAAPPPPPPISRTTGATQIVLGDTDRRLRQALQDYFNGEFDRAERGFRDLTRDLPRNGWIWAFLGASQYSQYAFEGEDSYKASAIDSFRKAKSYGKWKDGLPEKYFSRKIRKAFKENAG